MGWTSGIVNLKECWTKLGSCELWSNKTHCTNTIQRALWDFIINRSKFDDYQGLGQLLFHEKSWLNTDKAVDDSHSTRAT